MPLFATYLLSAIIASHDYLQLIRRQVCKLRSCATFFPFYCDGSASRNLVARFR